MQAHTSAWDDTDRCACKTFENPRIQHDRLRFTDDARQFRLAESMRVGAGHAIVPYCPSSDTLGRPVAALAKATQSFLEWDETVADMGCGH
jgi:hypothetical protein